MKLSVNSRNIYLLGLHLVKNRPDIANELLNECMLHADVSIKDTSLIGYYFEAFCDLHGTIEHSYIMRKVFVGIILKIYYPYLFEADMPHFRPQKGFVTNLSATLKMPKGNTSKMVHQVRQWIRLYDDFNNTVNSNYETIIG